MPSGEIFEWDYWISSAAGVVHVVAALISLALGPLILRNRKGDARHRALGLVFVGALLTVNTTAFSLFELAGFFGFLFHALAVMSLAALLPGFIMIRRYTQTGNRKDLEVHAECMGWAYYGVLGAGIAQIFSRGVAPFTGIGLAMALLGVWFGASSWFFTRMNKRNARLVASGVLDHAPAA